MNKVVLIVQLIFFLALLASCCAPMECKPARLGFSAYKPIILALEKSKIDNNVYPVSLPELVPKYLAKIPTSPEQPRPTDVEYEQEKDNYLLKFTYGGPGMNYCSYRSIKSSWFCTGFY
ncbi:MAG: hypothetical protein ACC707_04870 [Thiohalomonadales bacterium]